MALQSIFDSAQIAVQEEIRNVTSLSRFKAVASRRKKFWAVSRDLNKVFFDYPFLVPDYFALITRAMIVLVKNTLLYPRLSFNRLTSVKKML